MQQHFSEIEEKIYKAFLELGGREQASIILKRVKSEVESGEEDEKLGNSSDSEFSTNSVLAVDNCLDDDIKEEKIKQLSSEAENKLLVKREFKDELSPKKSKLNLKVEMLSKCAFEAGQHQSQLKKRE